MSEQERLKWNTRYSESGAQQRPSALVEELGELLPRRGRALDIAGGGGRHAIWLAQRGLDVTLADISEVALGLARDAAAAAGVPLQTVALDFETDPFPEGPWDVLLSFHYLWRPLFTIAPRVLAPGGPLEGRAVLDAVHAGGPFRDYERAFSALPVERPRRTLAIVA